MEATKESLRDAEMLWMRGPFLSDRRQRSQTQDPGESFCARYNAFLFCFLSFLRECPMLGEETLVHDHTGLDPDYRDVESKG